MNKIFLFVLLVVSFNAFSGFGDLSEDEISSICAATGLTRDELLKNTGTHQNQSVQTADQDPLSALSPQELAEALKAECRLYSQQAPQNTSSSSSSSSSSSIEGDAALALRLQTEEESAAEKRRAEEEATQRLIQSLQMQEAGQTQQMHLIDDPEKSAKFYAKKPAILEAFEGKMGKIQDMDVHAFNGRMKPEFSRLIALDTATVQTKTGHSWQEIHRVLTEFMTTDEECKKSTSRLCRS